MFAVGNCKCCTVSGCDNYQLVVGMNVVTVVLSSVVKLPVIYSAILSQNLRFFMFRWPEIPEYGSTVACGD